MGTSTRSPTNSRRTTVGGALEDAADAAMCAPSVLNSQPWRLVLRHDHMELHADRARWVPGVDPGGRLLVQAVGAALLNARVALAAQGWAVRVDRLPEPGRVDQLARLRPVEGRADPALARLAPSLAGGRAAGAVRPVGPRAVVTPSDGRLRGLAAAVVDEGGVLFPVLTDEQHRLVDRLTHQARISQQHDPVVLASVRYWTRRPAGTGEGGSVVPLVRSGGAPPVVVVLATHHDDLLARVRSGEALQRVLLEVTAAGGAASPIRPALELDTTRAQLRTTLTWDTWPQSLVQITAEQDPATGLPARRRRRSDVVSGSTRTGG